MKRTAEPYRVCDNQLVAKLVDHCNKQGLSLDEMARELCFSEKFLKAMVQGEIDIRELSLDGFRQISAVLGISCVSALILVGYLTMDDLIDHRN